MRQVFTLEQQFGEPIPQQTINDIVQAIIENFEPEKILLFGSYGSGKPTPDSDLDLLVIMESDLPRYKRAVPIRMLFRPMPCAMDILIYTPAEVAKWKGTVNHIITEAFRSGKVVYERAKH